MTPTQRTLKHVRDEGYLAEVVEHWNSHAKIRQDLFGFVDVVALRPGETVGIQCTSTQNVSARVAKIRASDMLEALKSAGWSIRVMGWTKGKRGGPHRVETL